MKLVFVLQDVSRESFRQLIYYKIILLLYVQRILDSTINLVILTSHEPFRMFHIGRTIRPTYSNAM